jgi:hypothetical protein
MNRRCYHHLNRCAKDKQHVNMSLWYIYAIPTLRQEDPEMEILCTHDENGKLRLAETILRIGVGRDEGE